jgi:DNA-binding MarR family transcriptional regulator
VGEAIARWLEARVSGECSDRAELLRALEYEARTASAQSVMLSQAIADRVGLHPTDLECMDFLNLKGAMPAGRLADYTGLTTGAITGVIDRLEAAGYARREKDPRDRRRVIVALQAEKTLAEVGPSYEQLGREYAALLDEYSDTDLALLLDYTRRANELVQRHTSRLRDETTARRPAGRAS